MNEHAKLWVAALRSGEFQQGHGRLTTVELDGSELDCVLGVGCKVAMRAGVKVSVEEVLLAGGVVSRRYGGMRGILPEAVMEWLGLGGSAGDYAGGTLMTENDGGVRFPELAAFIASEPEGLFTKETD